MTPKDAYEAANILQDLGYDVLDPSFSNVVDVRLRSTQAEVTIEIYENGFDYTFEDVSEGVYPFWSDVLAVLASDKARVDARPRPAPPYARPRPAPPYARVWTELDDLSTMSCNNPPVGCCVCVLVLAVVLCLWAFA